MARSMRDIVNEADSKSIKHGDLVRAARKRLELTQEEVCRLTGLKRENLSAIENGRVQMTAHYAEIFGAVFGLHPASILFPNVGHERTGKLLEIERRARELLKKKRAG
jgi:transcriptional regulator with XRE-family HTH domain